MIKSSFSHDELPFLVLAKTLADASNEELRLSCSSILSTMSTPKVDIHVSIGSGQTLFGYYVQYKCTLTCPLTCRSWSITKRFSEMLAFRNSLEKLQSSTPLLEEVITLPFPKKHLDAEKPHIIAARIKGFEVFLRHLVALYAHCLLPTTDSPLNLSEMLQEFLDVPNDIQNIKFEAAPSVCEKECTICLDSFDHDQVHEPGTILKLACGHFFHRECLHDWFTQAMTCPMCRGPITHLTAIYEA
ncbi:hypothetical protein THRCLA_08699 [Thraustotheca clavata]|uniref:RING-type domain-containing protein n=1 Tax=Thraustotheca clavata TaxID=74557 RepID=A0A1V9Z382_9STRA|nr:hypothetical protein THRCLA_08699 [Thraustotheca clavata]